MYANLINSMITNTRQRGQNYQFTDNEHNTIEYNRDN